MDDSILGTIAEQMLGDSEETGFDSNLKMFLNSAISDLQYIGYEKPDFEVVDRTQTWGDLFEEDTTKELQRSIREYLYLSVKVKFDPPQSSALMTHYIERMNRLEWQIRSNTDY